MAYGAILGQTNTTYTKDQILSSSDATLLGLSSTATPADMFNVLSHVGDLHVWRRTFTAEQGKDAWYTLGDKITGTFYFGAFDQNTPAYATYMYSDSITVSHDGTFDLSNPASISPNLNNDGASNCNNTLRGKFVKRTNDVYTYFNKNEIYFIPNDATFTFQDSTSGLAFQRINVDKYQTVTGHPAIPPGESIVDYPVSTNRNAYQEGSDAKPAGYTLGEVQNGTVLSDINGNGYYYVRYSDSVSVSNDGTVSLGGNVVTGNYSLSNEGFVSICKTNVVGKFCKFCKDGSSEPNDIYYIPNGATFSNYDLSLPYTLSVTKLQTVTGYPAIPAGTTIEYLGNLGDKSRMQIVSYVGTGTYGASHPCSITADFPIESATVLGFMTISSNIFQNVNEGTGGSAQSVITSLLSNTYTEGIGFTRDMGDIPYGKISTDMKTISWYTTRSAVNQLNSSSVKYFILCRG